MAALKCKYCGGNISPLADNRLGTCTVCGGVMTLPADLGKRCVAAHNCGNYLRRAGKFDKALDVYKKILSENEQDAEGYWCCALCQFGVQYAEEDGQYAPVVLRPNAGDFLKSEAYLAAISLSDGTMQQKYKKEAEKIAACCRQPEKKRTSSSAASLKKGFLLLKQGNFTQGLQVFQLLLDDEPNNAMAHFGCLLAENGCPEPKDLANCNDTVMQNEHYLSALQNAQGDLKKFLEATAEKIRQNGQNRQVKESYAAACAAMDRASSREEYLNAARMLERLGAYSDAEERAAYCIRKAEELRKQRIYDEAANAMRIGNAAYAAKLYSQIPGWRDANVQAVQCKKKANAQSAAAAEHDTPAAGVLKRIVAVFMALCLISVFGWLFVTRYIVPQKHYESAEALLASENWEEAIDAFAALGSFKDSASRVAEIQSDRYSQAEVLLHAGDPYRAAAIFGGLRDYEDAAERSAALWADIVSPELISAGGWFTVALRSDNIVAAIGDDRENQCDVGGWLNIASVSAGWEHTVGLRTDGTVVAAGYSRDGRTDVEQWKNMVAVSAGQWHTIGLKSNGRVIGIGCDRDGRTDVDEWRYIVGISAGRNHTLGLKADRTAVAAGQNTDGQCNVSNWENLQSVSAGGAHSLGLKRDGTVYAAGNNQENQCDVSVWSDIVAVSAGYYHSVGLKSDGTVVAVGLNEDGQCDVSEWTDIVAISAGGWHTLGLRSDGSIVAVGRDICGQCQTTGWDNMMVP